MSVPRMILAGVVCALLAAPVARAGSVQPLVDAQFVLSNTTTPPTAATWQPRRVPDNWNKTQGGDGGIGWYRFEVIVDPTTSEPWAVALTHRATVYVNGTPVGGAEDLVTQRPGHWHRPTLCVVPAGLLRPGFNEIDIGIASLRDRRGGLYHAEFGPLSAIQPRFQTWYFLKVTLLQVLCVVTAALAAMFGIVWLRRRNDTMYGWFAAALVVAALRSYLGLVNDYRLDPWPAIMLLVVTSHVGPALIVPVFHRYFALRRPLIERVILWYSIALALLLVLLQDQSPRVAPAFTGGALAIGVYLIWSSTALAWRTRGSDEVIIALGVLAQLVFGINDGLLFVSVLPHQDWYLMQYASSAMVLILAWMLTSRFTQALTTAESARDDLARLVQLKTQQLETTFRQMQALERRQAVADERERIMRDLHDGIGGQLVSAIALSQSAASPQPVMTQTLREALDDLRLVIDSLDPVDGDLLALLGTLRARLEQRLAEQGLRITWDVEDLPPIPGFSSEHALQVLRIVQEAITNTLKHAQARTVAIRTGTVAGNGAETGMVFVEVADDGRGLGSANPGGRGLHNMQERAARIGGRLDLLTTAQGTTVRLSLPLPSHVHGIASEAPAP